MYHYLFITFSQLIFQYVNENEDTENDDLLNSVIIETVSMVISKPTQTQNIEGSHSNLRNFKKFKRV